MKLLLAGFSAQNAGMLNALIVNHQEYTVAELPLSFDNRLRLCLPTIPAHHQDAVAMLINLGGVGMPNLTAEQVSTLTDFVDERVALFIVQSDSHTKHLKQVFGDSASVCVPLPYNKQVMAESLAKLFKLAKDKPSSKKITSKNQPLTAPPATPSTQPTDNARKTPALSSTEQANTKSGTPTHRTKPDTQKSKKASTTSSTWTAHEHYTPNRNAQFLHTLLDSHFAISQVGSLHKFVQLLEHESPIKAQIGDETIYVNRFINVALIGDYAKLLENCHANTDNLIQVSELTKGEFDEILNQAQHGVYQKYPFNTLMWQMVDCLLPRRIEVPDHSLLLKMRFMPNFGNASQVPEYMRTLTSSCLLKPRGLNELTAKMGLADKGLVNRLFLLAILSGTADSEILQTSFHQTTTPQSTIKPAKTGLFTRLSSRFGF